MAQKLAEKIKGELGRTARIEGLPTADWVLIDAGDVIVHLFRPEVRSFYNLERMWAFGDAPPTPAPPAPQLGLAAPHRRARADRARRPRPNWSIAISSGSPGRRGSPNCPTPAARCPRLEPADAHRDARRDAARRWARPAFAEKLGRWRDDGVREARFLIGAADGFDDAAARRRRPAAVLRRARPGRICSPARCWPSNCGARPASLPTIPITAKDEALMRRAIDLPGVCVASARCRCSARPSHLPSQRPARWLPPGPQSQAAPRRSADRSTLPPRQGRRSAAPGAGGRRRRSPRAIEAAEADIAAARGADRAWSTLLDRQRARLADAAGARSRACSPRCSLARRPAVASLVQPGSVDDLVHVRAVLASTMPVVRARTAALAPNLTLSRQAASAGVGGTRSLRRRTRKISTASEPALLRWSGRRSPGRSSSPGRHSARNDATLAGRRDARAGLDDERRAPRRPAGSRSRPRPPLDPLPARAVGRSGHGPLAAFAYRLPVNGRLVTGLGELSTRTVSARAG